MEKIDRSEAKAFTHPSQYDTFIHLLQSKLPQELRDQIAEITFNTLICPGHIFPKYFGWHPQANRKWNTKQYTAARPELLRLDKAIYKEYHIKYWRDNVFVVSSNLPSSAKYSTAWMNSFPSNFFTHVRKIYLSFTVRDWGDGWSDIFPQPLDWEFPALPWNKQPQPPLPRPAPVPVAAALHPRNMGFEYKLMDIWVWKFRAFCMLPLKELTLDLMECYGVSGSWIGSLVFMIDRFRGGVVSELRVIAPDRYGEELVLGMLRENNDARD
ncbi:MAG: hypothetical protein Q9198_010769 [Flavoplaca austrocitrina]